MTIHVCVYGGVWYGWKGERLMAVGVLPPLAALKNSGGSSGSPESYSLADLFFLCLKMAHRLIHQQNRRCLCP